ncbi:hypothetical protein HUJ04_002675 [Dendroctonus ponderosae]|nr:hypothetical protein HUJ04_002675 [Dendroctonus ponderosae]
MNVDKEEKIELLRKMIEDEPALCNFPYENDKLLERFLRGTEFDVEEAFKKIKLYYKLILEHPEWFTKEAPLNRKDLLEKDVRIALPAVTDKDGRPVYVAKLGNCDPSKMALLDVIAVDDIWIESILLNSDPEKGLCVLLDIANLPWKSIKWLTPHNIMVGLKKLQCLPFKDFRFHVVNNSFILNAALKIVWPFLPEDIKKTVKFHFNNRDSLHGFIDPDVLPDEYGGRKGDINYSEIYEQLYAQNEEIFESLQLQRNLVIDRDKHEVCWCVSFDSSCWDIWLSLFSNLEQFKELKCDQNASSGDDDDDDFPPFFDDDQLRHGGIVVCFLMAIYSFTLLAIVCDKYFIPSIERLCEVLNISADVGAATFMSVATSCPELFTNLIATFVTGSSLGIGTIVGSSMFNSLGVASIGSLAAIRPIKLDWYPVTRDISIYMVAISILIAIVWDDHIYWYEGLTLFICYFLYFIVMFQNPRISRFIRRTIDKYRSNNKVDIAENGKVSESKEKEYNRDSVRASVASAFGSYAENVRRSAYENPEEFRKAREAQEAEEIKSLTKSPFTIPEGGFFTKFLFFYTWLIKMALRLTIPNPKTHPAWWPVTFMLCIFWIGGNSYIVSWMVTLIGNVLGIPSTVQGMTFVAAGGSLPETLSIAIMTRRGEGKMGVSNSLGANSMNILFSLGMPWFFSTMLKGTIVLQSGSIIYTIAALLLVALILYFTLYFNHFTLSKVTGCVLLPIYVICIVLACLSEMVFFKNNSC